jgi:hypothetical protein
VLLSIAVAMIGAAWSMVWDNPHPGAVLASVLNIVVDRIPAQNALTAVVGAVGVCAAINVVLAFQTEESSNEKISVRFSQSRSDLDVVARLVALGAVMIGIASWFNLSSIDETGRLEVGTAMVTSVSALSAAWLAAIAYGKVALADYYADLVNADRQLALLKRWNRILHDEHIPEVHHLIAPSGWAWILRFATGVVCVSAITTAFVVLSVAVTKLPADGAAVDLRASGLALLKVLALAAAVSIVGMFVTLWELTTRWRNYKAAVRERTPLGRLGTRAVLTYLAVLAYGALLAAGVWAGGGGSVGAVAVMVIVATPPALVYLSARWSRHQPQCMVGWFIEPAWWTVRHHLQQVAIELNEARDRAEAAAAAAETARRPASSSHNRNRAPTR